MAPESKKQTKQTNRLCMSLSFVVLKVVVGRFFVYPSWDPVCSPTFKNTTISKHLIHLLHDTCFVFMHRDLLLTYREREREREIEERERERD